MKYGPHLVQHKKRRTCQAQPGAAAETSKDECRCRKSDQSSLATACARAEQDTFVSMGYIESQDKIYCIKMLEQGILISKISTFWSISAGRVGGWGVGG